MIAYQVRCDELSNMHVWILKLSSIAYQSCASKLLKWILNLKIMVENLKSWSNYLLFWLYLDFETDFSRTESWSGQTFKGILWLEQYTI